ncbi:hypothetical protein Q3G72_024066 [Acer saccharum]|nr:hypothetical protein Q3G72_024066 [Acer saccharum]
MSKSSWVIEQSKLSNRASDIALQKGSEDSLSSIETTFKATMAVENNLASKSGEVVIEVSSNENSYVEKDCLSISSAIDEDFVKEIIDIENQFSAVGKESVNIFSSVEEVNGIDRMDLEEELVQATVLVENCFFQNSNQASSGFEKEATIRAGVAKSGSKKGRSSSCPPSKHSMKTRNSQSQNSGEVQRLPSSIEEEVGVLSCF